MQNFKNILIFFIGVILTSCGSNPHIVAVPETAPSPKKLGKVKVAVILGAGGSKGLAHLGVLEVLEENNISIDLIVGCSAGSIIGALYADNPNSLDLRDRLINLKRKDLLDTSWFSALQSPWRPKGPVQGYLLQKFLVDNLQTQNFEDLKIPFICATCDLHTGELFAIRSGPIAPAVLASCSIPPFFAPIELYGKTLVDGGVTDPVPVDLATPFKPDLIIAIDIATPLSDRKPSNLISITNRCAHISYLELSKLRAKQADVTVKPNLKAASMFDDSQNWRLYELGREAALEKLEEIKQKLR